MGCKMSRNAGIKGRRKANKKDTLSEPSTIKSVDIFPHVDELQTMKRAQLQKLCKKAGIKATGKNAELIDRLKERINLIETNNNNSNKTKNLSPRITSSEGELHDDQSGIHNTTFEVSCSAVSIHDQVHVTSVSTPVSHGSLVCDSQTHLSDHVDIPVIPTEVHVGDDRLEEDGVSRGVLKESNKTNTDADAKCSTKPNTTAHTRWCVVEGLLKQGEKSSWRRIHLIGGRPVISNRFGKCVSFVLEPSGIPTPENCDDNYICGTCVMNNESYLRVKAALRGVSSDLSLIHVPQEGIDIEVQGTPHRIPRSSSRSFTRIGSVKRKRRDHDSCAANSSGEFDNLEKKRKQDSVTSSKPGTPASPQVRRARGEKLPLPRNIHNPWRPKKSRKATDHVKEDIDFAKRVEEIIKNTMPGSEEEMCMIMSSKAGRVQRSPTKSAE